MDRIRLGVMGCAAIARRHVLPALREMPEYEIRAIASRNNTRAEEFASRFGGDPVEGYQSLVERQDIDAVYVPLPTGLHGEWVRKLLLAGKHVMVEKSLAMNLPEARSLVELAAERCLVLMEHFQFLYHAQTEFVRGKLTASEFGRLHLLRISFGFPPLDPRNFRYDVTLGGGALLDAGAYTLRATQLFIGEHVRVAAAVMSSDGACPVDLRGEAMLVSESGETAQLAWGFDHVYQCSVDLWGQHGRITQDRAFTAGPGFSPKVCVETSGLRQEYTLPPDNHFVNIWKAFHRKVVVGPDDATSSALLTQARLIEEVRTVSGGVVS